MNHLRCLVASSLRARPLLFRVQAPKTLQTRKYSSHDEGPPQPFDNLPFSLPNRYVATVIWCVFFGVGLWAPFLIVWYSMAKRTL